MSSRVLVCLIGAVALVALACVDMQMPVDAQARDMRSEAEMATEPRCVQWSVMPLDVREWHVNEERLLSPGHRAVAVTHYATTRILWTERCAKYETD